MENDLYTSLMNKIKVFVKEIKTLPIAGEEGKYKLTHIINNDEKFTLRINRKGHRNLANLTILISSDSFSSQLVRFDVNGPEHTNYPEQEDIPTPHLHIFSEEYQNGQKAVPLSELTDIILINELIDSLDFFLDYVNVKKDNLHVNNTLL